MAGIIFPDFARAIGGGMALRQQQQQSDMIEEDRAAKKAAGALVPQALGGDRDALGKIGTLHPDTAMKIAPLLERMDTNQRARAKEAAEWTTRAAMGVLSLPPEQRPAAYQAALAEGQKLGFQIDMPPQYDRAVEGRLNQVINQARPLADYFKDKSEGFELVPSGGGGAAPPAGGGVNQYNIGNVRPVGGGPQSGFQQPASLDDGIRLAVNNVKAYPAKFNGGQPMTLLQIGERWAPRGDGANDPVQWARNVASIGGLDPNQPLDLNDPMIAAKFARGVHGAEHGANKVLPPERYAQAITGGAQPPGLAQGDNTRADASGNPIQTSDGGTVPREAMRMITPNLPPGANLGRDRKTGKFMVQEGNFVVYDNNKNPIGLYPIPKPKEQGAAPAGYRYSPDGRSLEAIPGGPADKQQGAGPFTGKSPEAEGLNLLVQTGVLTARQAAELAAGKTITDPKTGVVMFATPTGLMGQAPNGQTAPIVPPGVPAAPPAGGAMPSASPGAAPSAAPPAVAPEARSGMIPLTAAKPETMTESQAKAYGFAQRMATANSLLDDLAIQGTSKRGRFLEGLPGGIGNLAQTPEFQRFEQAKRNFMNAQLRDESGAVIGPSEFMSADLQYFPQPGQATNKELIAQMAENRRQVVEAMMVKAGMLKRGERYDPPAKTVDPAEKGRLLFEAKKALDEGRDPKLVRERLKKLGVDPAELDGAN